MRSKEDKREKRKREEEDGGEIFSLSLSSLGFRNAEEMAFFLLGDMIA
jgi:hypothetical protein